MDQSTATSWTGCSTGVLLHPTALPGSPVCGSFGEPCRRWLQLLAEHGIGSGRCLPLAPPDQQVRPTAHPSCNALNPWFLDGQDLAQRGSSAMMPCRGVPGADAPLEQDEHVISAWPTPVPRPWQMHCSRPGLIRMEDDRRLRAPGPNSNAPGWTTMSNSVFCMISTAQPGGLAPSPSPGMTLQSLASLGRTTRRCTAAGTADPMASRPAVASDPTTGHKLGHPAVRRPALLREQ